MYEYNYWLYAFLTVLFCYILLKIFDSYFIVILFYSISCLYLSLYYIVNNKYKNDKDKLIILKKLDNYKLSGLTLKKHINYYIIILTITFLIYIYIAILIKKI